MAKVAAAPLRIARFLLRSQAAKPFARFGHPSPRRRGPGLAIRPLRARKLFSRVLLCGANAVGDISDGGLHHVRSWLRYQSGGSTPLASSEFFAPAPAFAFDKRDRGGGPPSASEIGAWRLIHMAPGFQNRVDPAPGRFD